MFLTAPGGLGRKSVPNGCKSPLPNLLREDAMILFLGLRAEEPESCTIETMPLKVRGDTLLALQFRGLAAEHE
jgi:hypothetical protein